MSAALPLREYQRKRRWEKTAAATPEPEPKLHVVPPARTAGLRFCVQQHRARQLHYDLRLEMNGVLKSWAVPKGPSLDPEVKRLAIATEDHPLEYLTFEGAIPKGNYGAGDVIVWDLGEYEPVGAAAPQKQWEQGHIKFKLQGKKLHGEFALTHLPAPRNAPEGREDQWLLVKKRDDAAVEGDDASRHPGSVLAPPEPRAGPRLVAARGRKDGSTTRRTESMGNGAGRDGLEPMLASLAGEPFRDDGWVFEIKWDGVRAAAACEDGGVRLFSRRGREVSAAYPELRHFPEKRRLELDGEIVVLDGEGISRFHLLQQRMNLADTAAIAQAERRWPVVYYAFDLLAMDGRDLRPLPLLERKRRLAELPWAGPWRYSDHVAGDGVGLFTQARERGLEGIVGKRADAPYQPGRSRLWLKFKTGQRQEVAIVGYTEPQGSRTSFGALLLAVFDPAGGRLQYAGRVGTGFDAPTRAAILRRLRPQTRAAVAGMPAHAHAVRPDLIAEVKFAEWTPAGLLRAPVFLGLRPDKVARDCVRETVHAA